MLQAVVILFGDQEIDQGYMSETQENIGRTLDMKNTFEESIRAVEIVGKEVP